MNGNTYEWGIESSDGYGMMGGTGCGHKHQLIANAENCLSMANRRMAGSSGWIANAGVFHADGTELDTEEHEAVVLDLIYDRDGMPAL